MYTFFLHIQENFNLKSLNIESLKSIEPLCVLFITVNRGSDRLYSEISLMSQNQNDTFAYLACITDHMR